jgi:hypothetical protein
MDREAGNEADTDSEPQTHATGSAASADEATTQPIAGLQETGRQDAGPRGAGLTEAGPLDAEPTHAGPQEASGPAAGGPAAGGQETGGPAADGPETGRPEAGLTDAEPHEAGRQETGLTDAEPHDAGGPETGLTEAEPHEAGRPESALAVIQGGTAAGLTTRTPANRTPATRTPATRTVAGLTPPRRTLARAGDRKLAGTPGKNPAGAARRGQTSQWAQPPRRLVPVLRPVFPGLAADPRLPIWIARILTATAVGVAVTIWQDWRLGLTAAAAVVILDIIYRSRTTSVIPAAVRVTSAQRRTRRRLALLRGRGYVALNARAIPGSDSVIDHLVIGPPGVFALDSERWDRRLPVRTAASGRLYHGPFGQEERLEHAVWEAAQASSLLGASLGRPISVRPAMVIYGPTIPWTVASLREVDVLAGRRLRKYFRRQARAAGPRLDADQISQIHAAAARALPPAR